MGRNGYEKKIIFTALSFALLAQVPAQESAQAQPLSLEGYIALVERNNKDLQLATLNEQNARSVKRQAMSAFLPKAALTAGYTHLYGDVALDDDMTKMGLQTMGVSLEDLSANALSAGLGVTMNLFDASAIGTYRFMSKGHEFASLSRELTREYLVLNAKKLYAQVQLLDLVVAVQEEMVVTNGEIYESQKKKYGAGTITELDMRMAEVDLKNAELSLIQSKKNRDVALVALKSLAGIAQEEEIRLEKDDTDTADIPDVDVEKALQNRADYKLNLKAVEMAEINLKKAYGSFLPTLSGSFYYSLGKFGIENDGSNFFAFNTADVNDWAVTFRAVLPLCTGGLRSNRVSEAKKEKEMADLQLSKRRDDIERELTELHCRLSEVKIRLDGAQVLEQAAERAAHLAKTALKSGLGTQLSVSQAESKLAQARLNQKNALYEYKAALYDWQFSMGGK